MNKTEYKVGWLQNGFDYFAKGQNTIEASSPKEAAQKAAYEQYVKHGAIITGHVLVETETQARVFEVQVPKAPEVKILFDRTDAFD